MKKLFFILLMLPAMLLASPVDPSLAQQVADNFISSTEDSLSARQRLNQPRHLKRVAKQTADTPPYYIFNNEDGGFVIVSGDDCATPILGYSNEGSIDLDNMPIQLQELLQAYAMEIQDAVDKNLAATDEVAKSWAEYKKAPQAQTTTTAVSALISTSWDQYPRYNNKCPVDASLSAMGGHPSTGCVATAMAQIMKYWGYPETGEGNKSYRSEHYGTLSANFGITTYDWANMPLKLSSSTSATQNNAVATLMYHCGVAVSMSYNSDGEGSSGAYVIDYGGGRASAEVALKKYFGYASTLQGKQSSSMSASAWTNMLKTELDNQRPVLYAGCSPNGGGGHAFICDGYDSNNKFHFNWGWSGQANGFFSLTALTPGNYNFSSGQQAVVGIKPKDGSGPAKNYDLYMNTDLEAVNTSSSTSAGDVNPYSYGKTITFAAKIENNGTGVFNGSFKVGVYAKDGEFVAWSKESYHFSLGAGQTTVRKTYTFDGGAPFLPGRYRAYMYYLDDDETDPKLVKTDEGVFLTEYNNIAFDVISSGDLVVVSGFTSDDPSGNFKTGSNIRVSVDVKNGALLSTFYGKIRLNFYNLDGTRAQIIDEINCASSGISPLSTYTLSFYNNSVEVEPGTYYMALVYQEKNETTWYFMRNVTSNPNPVKVIVTAYALRADDYEVNNTQATATTLLWDLDPEMMDFSTLQVSLHEDADIDYYKLDFPKSNKYKINISLYDKYNKGGMWYENADAQFAYSIGGNTYSEYYKIDEDIEFNGPTTLYLCVKPFGLNGLGYYELAGEIEESGLNAIDDAEVDNSPSKILRNGQIFILRGDKTHTLTGQEVK